MPLQQIYSGLSIGTTNAGEKKLPQQFTVSDGCASFALNARLLTGVGSYIPKGEVMIWYCASSFDVYNGLPVTPTVTATIPTVFAGCNRYLTLKPNLAASAYTVRNTLIEDILGGTDGFYYVWLDLPTFSVAAMLDVNLIELP